TQAIGEWTIHPWFHSNCNSLLDADQLRPVPIPDIHPARVFFHNNNNQSNDKLDSSVAMATKVKRVMTQPINLIFRFLQTKERIQIWLFQNKDLRIEGRIIGFDEYMNLVLDEAEEVSIKKKKKKPTRKQLGRILLKGDSIALMMNSGNPPSCLVPGAGLGRLALDISCLGFKSQGNNSQQPIPPASVAPAGQHVAPEILAAHNTLIKGSKDIAGLMLMTMEPEIQRNLKPLHVHEMLRELKTLFAQQAEQELLQTTRDFHSCRQEEGQSVSSYVLKMKGYIDNLERLGNRVTLGLGVSLILIGLRKEYDGFVQNYNMHSMGKTVNKLHAMLKLHEQTLPKSNAPALHAIRADKVQKDSICHECGEIGHWKRNYPQYLAELLKKKKNAASGAGGSSIFVIELNTILNRSWIYDTGCGTHICNTTQGLRASRKLKSGALSLYVGNGQREVVEAIGAFYLCLSSGLEIVLNNCHYAPSITRGVISVFRLYEDGFVNRFVDNTIQVSRNNVVYCAIPRDGIFEIDLSNSLTNESSIYAVSNKRAKLDLDSAHIEKLQHDGLLDSSDLRAFEKCVSCMSGKMAKKPYTHQLERAKDLLGLIHTDVCGPFKIMSRQEASYFVTFNDDFSRYGYVYLLKHKNEVFETFKVF
nr:hypothetical protein [Tanacetum cinerariifolium]